MPTGETLLKWNESNASVRKNFSVRRLIFPLILMVVIIGGMTSLKIWAGTLNHFPIVVILIFPVFLLASFLGWFSAGAIVCLNEFCIVRSAGKYGSRTDYGEIKDCFFRSESYAGKTLFIFQISLKEPKKFRISPAVDGFIVPEEVGLDQVLQILRKKRVNVIGGQLPS